ncbi:MAG: 50S ribosomal protein L30e [Candidatus Methanomethyliaceae archaeon]|nr:50S ribosomal protein L30e [Candidatus Methanomethyliaceae archaeon]MDW7970325.1 50S ribosomal protein L30e [Nitrososphaerota archaeon]
MDLAKELKVAMNTGKVEIGYRTTIKAINRKHAKLIIMASNIPEKMAIKIKQAAGNSIPIFTFPGSSWDLGSVCGRPHTITSIAIIDPGESSILEEVK